MVDESRVASMNPSEMLAGGLKGDFDGRIVKVRFVPWDYNGKLDHHILGVAVTIKPDDEDEFVQHYSASDLELFMPSKDGENPVDLTNYGAEGSNPEDAEGIYALKVGKKDQLSNNSNWAFFITQLLVAQYPLEKLRPNVDALEGIYGHWDRIPQKKRSGLVKPTATADGRAKNDDILVITELKQAPAGTAAAKKPGIATKPPAPVTSSSSTPAATTKAPTPAAPAAGAAASASANGLDAKLVEIVRAALAATGGEPLPKAKLAKAALDGLAGAEKGKGVKRIMEADFLAGYEANWVFDADTATLISTE